MSYTEEVLGIVNKAYNEGEGRIDEDVGEKDRGDGLATFLRNEVIDVTKESFSRRQGLMAAQTAVNITIDELHAVSDALTQAVFDELNKENNCGN